MYVKIEGYGVKIPTKNNTLKTVWSMLKYSPNPPQTPATFKSLFLNNNFFIIKNKKVVRD